MFKAWVAERGLASEWEAVLQDAGHHDAARVALLKGIIGRESEWNPAAINPTDPSYGLMQILAGSRGPYPSVSTAELLDPVTNIRLGAAFLNQLLGRYSERDAVSAYNAGRPIAGNQPYVDDVLTYQTYYLNHLPAGLIAEPALEEPSVWATPGGGEDPTAAGAVPEEGLADEGGVLVGAGAAALAVGVLAVALAAGGRG